MKSHGSPRRSIEGQETATWIVQDYGDVVLHVLDPKARSLYDLEHLWGDAHRVER
jgi:ribosome-associated protein